MQNIAQAEDFAFVDTGYYFSIENLNDLAYGSPIHYFDDINYGGGTAVIDLRTGQFKPERVNLLEPVLKWKGPYITYDVNRITQTGEGYDIGTLLDFWYNPYYLFSPVGLARPASMSITQELYGDAFDTYAIVSLGPDGQKSDDDIKAYFGVPPTSLVVSSVYPTPAIVSEIIAVRGYNFGDSQGESYIELNSKSINNVEYWSDRQIRMELPSDAQSGLLSVIVGDERSNELLITVRTEASAAGLWTFYQ
jgi:hypothetical protein